MKNNRKKKNNRKLLVLTAVFLAIIFACAVVYFYFIKPMDMGNQSTDSQAQEKLAESNNITKNKEQHKEKDQAEEKSKNDSQKEPPEKQQEFSKVTPIIVGFNKVSSGNAINIDGLISNIIESGGQCTFSITWSGGSVSQTTKAFAEPQSTSCASARIDMDKIPEDKVLKLSVHYKSNKYEGQSNNNPTISKGDIR